MRILHVITAFPRSTDDVIVPWLVELLKHLRAAGHEVEVLTSAFKGGGNREFAGIPVHRFRYFPARWEDLTHEEAAEVLGCPIGTVKTHILRAKEKLRTRLGAWAPEH